MNTFVSEVNDYTDFAHLYDFDDRSITKDDIPFFLEYAKKINGDILELACGTGRVLLPLAKAGFNVWGLDITKEMLEQFKMKLSRETEDVQNRVTLIEQDMTSFKLDKKFSMITIPYRTFQLLINDTDQINCLKNVHSHLSDNGTFILTVFRPGQLTEDWTKYPEQEDWSRKDEETGITYKATNAKTGIDVNKQIIYPDLNYYITEKSGEVKKLTQRVALKYYQEYQIKNLLQETGFEVVEEFGYYDKRPLGEGTEYILVCKKTI